MRRILEKLSHERTKKEKLFLEKFEELRKKNSEEILSSFSFRLQNLLRRLEEISSAEQHGEKKREKGLFAKKKESDSFSKIFFPQLILFLAEIQNLLLFHLKQTRELFASFLDLLGIQAALADARDREWDALGSNHVGMIFKSMEWRVDKLAAEYEDVKLLMRKFLLLKEKLDRLLTVLEEKKMPTPGQIREISQPLEDWRYAGFENRFRGEEREVKKQQEIYLSYFKKGDRVLDLGCGRGEFLELLQARGISAAGIDSNSQMVEICLDKGLNCLQGDILEKLAERENNSLEGIFSSQVIEHLSPSYLRKLLDLAYFKLAPGGIIILETLNPTSVFALVQIYFLDLSHQKPIHPLALKFLLEAAGFEEVEIRYFLPPEDKLSNIPGADEVSTLLNENIDKLNSLIYAPANYAAVGRKR